MPYWMRHPLACAVRSSTGSERRWRARGRARPFRKAGIDFSPMFPSGWNAISPSSVRAGFGRVTSRVAKFCPMPMSWCIPFPRSRDGEYFRPYPRRRHPPQLQCARRQRAGPERPVVCGTASGTRRALSMKQAHDEVTRLETEMRSEIPEITTILTTSKASRRPLKPERRSFVSPNWSSGSRTL